MSALAISLALSVLSAEPAPTTHRYVVAVGFNESSNPERAPLRFADDDAARMFEVLRRGARQAHLLVRFDATSAETFSDLATVARAPTHAELKRALAEIRGRITEDRAQGASSELYFFYAGHGDQERGVGYVNLADGPLRRPEFLALIGGGPRADRTHVIVDACKSYFMVAGRGPGGVREVHTEPFAGPPALDGVGYVLSTSSDAEVHEWAAFGGGIFTHEVRSALVGAADADADGAVDYAELEAFVRVANEGIPHPRYRPDVFVRPPPGRHAPVFFTQPAVKSWLVLDSGAAGRVEIADQRGLRYADLHKALGTKVRLRLVEPYRYEVRVGARVHTVVADGHARLLSSLPVEVTTLAARSEAHRAFAHLFAQPFSADVVRGFRLAPRPLHVDRPAPAGAEFDALGYALVGGGAASLVASGVLAGFALDRRTAELGQSQVELADRFESSNRFAVAAAGLAAVGVGALVTELLRRAFTEEVSP